MADRHQHPDRAFELEGSETAGDFYRDWSESYDTDIAERGYAAPARIARALAEFVPDRSLPLLDLGCGTGVSGAALRDAGFAVIDGADFCAAMLERAAARQVYRALHVTDPAEPLPFAPGTYAAVAATGVLTPGHAPPGTIDRVLAILPPGGIFAFSLNDHALADAGYEGRIRDHVDCGGARVLFREFGDHLPGADLHAVVYVLQKT